MGYCICRCQLPELPPHFSPNLHALGPPGALWLHQCYMPVDPNDSKDWRQEEKRTTEDEMVGWHQWLKGLEFEWTQGDSEGQGSQACWSSGVAKSQIQLSDWTTRPLWPNSTTMCCLRSALAVGHQRFITLATGVLFSCYEMLASTAMLVPVARLQQQVWVCKRSVPWQPGHRAISAQAVQPSPCRWPWPLTTMYSAPVST